MFIYCKCKFMQVNLKMGDLFEDFLEFFVSLFEENLLYIFQ